MAAKHLKHGAIYAIGGAARQLIPFAMVPVLTRVLSREDYGLVAMFAVLTTVTVPLITLSAPVALMRSYFKIDRETHKKHVGTALLRIIPTGIIATLLMHFARDPLGELAAFPSEWVWLVGVGATSAAIVEVGLRLWQAKKQPFRYIGFQTVVSASELVLTFGLVFWLLGDWRGRVFGRVFALGLGAAFLLIWLVRRGEAKLEFDKEASKELTRFGVPLLPTQLAVIGMSLADRWFVAKLVGLDFAGLFAVGLQLASVMRVLESAASSAWIPVMLERLSKGTEADRRFVARGTTIAALGATAFGLTLGLMAPFVLGVLVGPQFQSAAPYCFWLTLAGAGRILYALLLGYYYHAGATGRLSGLSGAAFGLNLIACPFLIGAFGPVGAAASTCLVYWTHALLALMFRPRAHSEMNLEAG